MKNNFGSGKLINSECRVVRGTFEAIFNFPDNTRIKNNDNRLGYTYGWVNSNLSSLNCWLGDWGGTGNYRPFFSVELSESGNSFSLSGLSDEYQYRRNTPFELVFPSKKSVFPITTLRQKIDTLIVDKGDNVNLSGGKDPVFTTDLTAFWGNSFDTTLVAGGGNYCSMEMTPGDNTGSPPEFGGKISNDGSDGNINEDDPSRGNNGNIGPNGEKDDEDKRKFTADFIKIVITYFDINNVLGGFDKFRGLLHKPNIIKEDSIIPSYTQGSRKIINIKFKECPKDILKRQGVSFTAIYRVEKGRFFDSLELFTRYISVAVIDQNNNFDSIINKSLKNNQFININNYIFSNINIENKLEDFQVVHPIEKVKTQLFPSDQSKKNTAKVWSYSYHAKTDYNTFSEETQRLINQF